MKERDTYLRALVLDAVANDYEEFAMVVYEVTRWSLAEGFEVAFEEIRAALWAAVDDGLIRAHLFTDGKFEPVTRDRLSGEAYFLITEAGKSVMEPLPSTSTSVPAGSGTGSRNR